MRALLRSELIKLRTTRTFYALAGVTIGLAIVFVTLSAILNEPTEETVINDVFLSDPSSLFILILAIVGITGEWRHRTITSSLLAAPASRPLPRREAARVRGRGRAALRSPSRSWSG